MEMKVRILDEIGRKKKTERERERERDKRRH